MICEPCTRGGKWNKEKDYDMAREWHAKCTACECQHKTGVYIPSNKKAPTRNA